MKHLVHIQFSPQAGEALGSRPGGPVPVVGRLIERFKPEAVYTSPARQAIFLVSELSPPDMAELMLAACQLAGQHPDFIPVVDGKEFGAIAAQALPRAKALIDG